ncbi:hypothetical protein R3W88_022636 [Solanum pinnatisectum]|uniref:Aminotransferase-like plant mobile domain-containing protein n=1 Tax=Solanum pinnatisectum TaxID=50273 RepID=A0AAV9LW01_9SOLN|nr:hypothetical protein R3W88_022636 [Solanum pinnatisectum]
MQINQNLPNIRMMTEVPRTLKDWWGNIRVAYGNKIMPHLGSLIDLLELIGRAHDYCFYDCVDINLLPMVIYMFRGPVRVTIIWALEHFYQRHAKHGTEAELHNKIRSHAMRLSIWDAPNNEDGIPIERIVDLVQGWYGILDLGMRVESWCTLEYYTWFMKGGILTRPSYDRILGFTDTQRSNQIGTELLNLMPITTTMYHQLMMNQRKRWRKTQKRILENQLRRWMRIHKNIQSMTLTCMTLEMKE